MELDVLISQLSDTVELPYQRTFWDKDIAGQPPSEYFVWRVIDDDYRIQSENEDEVEELTIRISLFVKDKSRIEDIISSILSFVRGNGYKAYVINFEEYEADTKYTHKELEILY